MLNPCIAYRAGFLPGAILIIANWYLPNETQTRIAILYTSAATGGAFSGLLAFAIAKLDGAAGLAGWRWVRRTQVLHPLALCTEVSNALDTRSSSSKVLPQSRSASCASSACSTVPLAPNSSTQMRSATWCSDSRLVASSEPMSIGTSTLTAKPSSPSSSTGRCICSSSPTGATQSPTMPSR